MTETRVTDRSSMRRYRTEIPNIVLEMDLSIYARGLYVQLKKIAGDDGKCYYTARELAEMCRVSASTISKAKQELLDADLIRIEVGDKWTRDNITIVDMWPANFAYFAQEKETSTPDRHTITPDRHTITPDRHTITPDRHTITKEEPIKQEPIKESEAAQPPAPPRTIRGKPKNVFKSPYVDNSRFDLETGYIPAGRGTTAVEVYYERFELRSTGARLNAIKEDDLMIHCKDLDRLREVVTAYSQTTYQPGNLKLILDWYRDGVPEKHRAPSGQTKGMTSLQRLAANNGVRL